jgi:hypothetical protein
VPRRKTSYTIPSIDEAAFLRSVARPNADPAVFERARELAASVSNPLAASVVAEFWETSAPMEWIDGRGTHTPRLFLDRDEPPRYPGLASRYELGRRLHHRPTSLELAASLASDPGGVAQAQATAEEFLHRLRDWCDVMVPTRVGWCLADPRLYSYGPYTWERLDEYSTPFWLADSVLRSQGPAGAKLESSVRERLAALAQKELARRGWKRVPGPFSPPGEVYRDAQGLPTSGFVVERAADALGDWLCTRAAAAAAPASVFNLSGIGKLRDRTISDLPDPLDPLLSLYGTGYFPAWIESSIFLIGVPWSGPTISAPTLARLWETAGLYDENESRERPRPPSLVRRNAPAPTVTGRGGRAVR